MPSNPAAFDDRDDGAEDRANRKAAERVRQAKEQGAEPSPREEPTEDDEIEIGGGEPDPEDDDDEPQPGTRQAKKRARYDKLFAEERERSQRLEQTLLQSQQTIQQLANRPQPQMQPPPQPQEDPLDNEAKTLRAAQEGLQSRYADAQRRKDQAEVQRLNQEAWDLKDKIDRNSFARHSKALGHGQQRGMSPEQQFAQVHQMTVQAQAMQRYGDVLGNQPAARYYAAKVQERVALGHADDWDTHDWAAEEARRQFRMPSKVQRPAPTAAERRRLTGVSRGGAAPTSSAPTKITMKPEFKKMADAAYPHIKDSKKRYQKWVNGPGARLVAKEKI